MTEQMIKDLIQAAWNEGDSNRKDTFGDFLNRAAHKVCDLTEEASHELLATIEAMYPELKQGYWEGKGWQDLKKKHR